MFVNLVIFFVIDDFCLLWRCLICLCINLCFLLWCFSVFCNLVFDLCLNLKFFLSRVSFDLTLINERLCFWVVFIVVLSLECMCVMLDFFNFVFLCVLWMSVCVLVIILFVFFVDFVDDVTYCARVDASFVFRVDNLCVVFVCVFVCVVCMWLMVLLKSFFCLCNCFFKFFVVCLVVIDFFRLRAFLSLVLFGLFFFFVYFVVIVINFVLCVFIVSFNFFVDFFVLFCFVFVWFFYFFAFRFVFVLFSFSVFCTCNKYFINICSNFVSFCFCFGLYMFWFVMLFMFVCMYVLSMFFSVLISRRRRAFFESYRAIVF